MFQPRDDRNRVLVVGRKIEAETGAEIAEQPTVARPADHMMVGIDGAFVKDARTKNQRKNFEIVLGRIDSGSCSGKVFAAVRDFDDLARERVRSALRTARRQKRMSHVKAGALPLMDIAIVKRFGCGTGRKQRGQSNSQEARNVRR